MKIVYCINNTWYSGGMTRVLANKVNYWANQGLDVTIVTTDQIGMGDHYYISPLVKRVDLSVNYLGFDQQSKLKKILGLPIRMVRHRNRLAKLLTGLKPDILVSMFLKDTYLIPTLRDGSAKVLEFHTSRANSLYARNKLGILGKLLYQLDQFVIGFYDAFVVLTEEDKEDWGELTTIKVIPNANTFEPKLKSSLDNKVVLAAGRYSFEKNFEDLIQAWSLVSQQYPDWNLHIRGEGLEQLKPLIESLSLSNTVSISTTIDMEGEYMKASIYTLTSRFEGLGMVLLEAQACGVPLVAYACKCGPRDIIMDGENGFLIDEGDIEGMANRILKLIENETLRKKMGADAKVHSERFSVDKVMTKWNYLFEELMTKRK